MKKRADRFVVGSPLENHVWGKEYRGITILTKQQAEEDLLRQSVYGINTLYELVPVKGKKICYRCSLSPLRNSKGLRLVEMNDTGNKLLMCKDCRRQFKGDFKFVRKLKEEK